MLWRARQYKYSFPRPTLVMGILNVTPDSFSDGGRFVAPATAIAHAQEMAAEGADIIDVGGESSRPNAAPVDEAEEMRRVLPVIEQLAGRLQVPISIDTQKPAIAQAAVQAGASIINDIAANRTEPGMWHLVAETGVGYVAMHMQGAPQTMQLNPTYQDVVREVGDFFADRLERLVAAGVACEQVVLDVGIGFGKTVEHNLELLAGLNHFTRFRRPLLLGVSRKSFLGRLLKLETAERLPGALACACWGIIAGVNIVRTHDVAATVAALRMTEALLSRRPHSQP
jgi:dihydropteroate synthase